MTRQELESTYIKNEHGTFTPSYKLKFIEGKVGDKIVRVEDYTIIATAEEIYQEYLNPSVKTLKLNETEMRLAKIEEAIEMLATQIAKIKERK